MARLSSAETRTQLLQRGTNPIIPAGSVLTINLATARAINPEDILDALTTKFGAGKVHSDTDRMSFNGGWNLRVIP